MRLNKKQKEAVLQWAAEGLQSDEINRRAAKFKPRFTVSRAQVDFYRHSRSVQLNEIQQADETSALTTGLAKKEERVKVLQRLGNKFVEELLDGDKLWLLQVKGIGGAENFERVEYYEFNKAEVDSLRGVLDDIAAEVGERIKKTDITSGGEKLSDESVIYDRVLARIQKRMEKPGSKGSGGAAQKPA